jgi:peptidoglycan/xylan/chitin deacetylase (PgdA/CDA1 family)
MLHGKQILFVLVLAASMIGIALSDTNNTSVENITSPAANATQNIISNITDTLISSSTEIPGITASNTPKPAATSTLISYAGVRPTVIFTFDDGWLSLYNKAFPIMSANNQSGVAFVNIEPILGGWSDFITPADIKIMYTSGWDISSHTYSHADLTLQNDTSLKHELNDSKIWLDQNGYTRSSMFLSYPYGVYNNTVLAAVKNAGFLAARTVDPTTNYGHYALNSPDVLTMKNYEAIGGVDNDATIIDQINNTITVNGLLILSFHKIVDDLSVDEDNASTEFRVSDFQNVSNYLHRSNVDVITLSDYFGIQPKPASVVTNTSPKVTNTTQIANNTTQIVNTTPIITNTTQIVNNTTQIVNTTPIITNTTQIVNNTTQIVTDTTQIVAGAPDLSKYTREGRGGGSGYSIVQNIPPKPTPTLTVPQTPVPAETPDSDRIVAIVGQSSIKEAVVNKEEQPKSAFENIVGYFERIFNRWKEWLWDKFNWGSDS